MRIIFMNRTLLWRNGVDMCYQNNRYSQDIYFTVPGAVLCTLLLWTHLLTITLWRKTFYYPHFQDKNIEAQKIELLPYFPSRIDRFLWNQMFSPTLLFSTALLLFVYLHVVWALGSFFSHASHSTSPGDVPQLMSVPLRLSLRHLVRTGSNN